MFQRQIGEIFLLATLWGPSFFFTKVALQEIEPFTVVALRIGIGALLLFCIVKMKKIKIIFDFKLLIHCFILGFFVNGFPFLCFTVALKDLPTSLSALINGTTPVLTVILASLCLENERFTFNKVMGISMGLVGFLVLFLPTLFQKDINVSFFGMMLSFLGACSYAIGIVYARKLVQKTPPFVVPILQLFSSLTYLIPIALILESPLDLKEISVGSCLAILCLAVLGTTLAYIMYYRIITKYGATAVSMVTYLLPLFGTLLGVVFLDEIIDIYFYIAALLILCGIFIVNAKDFSIPKGFFLKLRTTK